MAAVNGFLLNIMHFLAVYSYTGSDDDSNADSDLDYTMSQIPAGGQSILYVLLYTVVSSNNAYESYNNLQTDVPLLLM